MRSKQLFAFFVVICIFFGMTACGNGQNDQSKMQNESAKSVTTNDSSTPGSEYSDYIDTTPTPTETQTVYFWQDNNMPAVTVNDGSGADPADFRPSMTSVPVKEGIEIKGAVFICSGGAFSFRGNDNEGYPVAQHLAERGYQSFVVDYRLRPYTMEEASLDLARAVRYVRYHAKEYGIDENDISVIGFSAGGILCGDLLLNFDGLVNGTAIDPDYIPDELDKVSADACAVGMVYSFYGRLSVASTDIEKFAASDLPPTYFLYGSEEIFRSQIEACADAARKADVSVETKILDGFQHGFGYRGDWIPESADWLENIMKNN